MEVNIKLIEGGMMTQKAHWKEVAKCVLVAESCIVDELKELKVNMEKEGKSVTEIADAYLERIVEEIFKRN